MCVQIHARSEVDDDSTGKTMWVNARYSCNTKYLVRFLAIFLIGLVASGTTGAAEISLSPSGPSGTGIWITGRIDRGDYAKLARFVAPVSEERFDAFLNVIFLDSPGGDVAEAMKIANLLDQSFASTVVTADAKCYSSCFLLWAAGVSRTVSGRLGIHRIALASSSIDVRRTEEAVRPATEAVEAFLSRMGIPRRILDKMSETSPSDLYVIDGKWLLREDLFAAVVERPAFLDVAEKRCGPSPTAAGLRTMRVPSDEEFHKWATCSDNVRAENQKMQKQKIIRLLNEAQASK